MTEFQTATLAIQEATLAVQQTSLAVQEAELEIDRSAIRVGIGQIVAGVLQTLVIAGELLFMRSESRARAQEHARRHEETMAAMQTRHKERWMCCGRSRNSTRPRWLRWTCSDGRWKP